MKALTSSEWVKRNNLILIDWLSFTISGIELEMLLEFLGFDDMHFAQLKGNKGYANKFYFDGVNINYDKTSEEMADFWVELSGQGCRVFESYGLNDWLTLLHNLLSLETINITQTFGNLIIKEERNSCLKNNF